MPAKMPRPGIEIEVHLVTIVIALMFPEFTLVRPEVG